MRLNLLIIFILLSCAAEVEEKHLNPLDRFFDDGDFRMVLNPPIEQSDGTYLIKWSNVFHREKGELFDNEFILTGPSFLVGCSCVPQDYDLQQIKENKLAPSFNQNLYPIVAKNKRYAGEFNLGHIPQGSTRSYVIYLTYRYTPTGKTGIIHSNVVVFKP